jgi:hypothetical protein
MTRIAVIGWGSLLWDLDDLAPKVRGAWHVARGPRLPFEFSRVSDKRKRALVVVIDREHGVECSTSFIESTRTDLDAAVDDLAARERAPRERIGHCTVDDDGPRSGQEDCIGRLRQWLVGADFQAAVWTDLPRNFEERVKAPFSIPRAIDYLKTLQGDARTEARRYVENAPANIETPLRAALREQDWWHGIEYSY